LSQPPKSAANLHERLRLRALAARDAMRDDLRAGWARTPTWLRVVGGVWITLSVALIVFLVVFDWNWARGPIGKIASAQLQRTVSIDGDLDVHPWSLKPRAEAARIRISQPAWAGTGQMVTVDRLAVQIEILPLFRRKVVLPLLRIDSPKVDLRRELSGRANWTFGDPNKKDKAPLKLPAIRHFVINDGAIRYDDRVRKMTFTGTVSSNEQAGDGGRGKFQLKGDGTLNGAKFLALITGGPLLNISPDRPYPIGADIRAGSTHLTADGRIDRPFDLGRFSANLMVEGSDLNNLYYLTGLSLPNTPPYRIAGALSRNGLTYDFKRFNGRVGDSDVSGDLSVLTGGERPLLKAAIVSKRLDFDDLGSLVGAAPATGRGETASAGQKQEGAQRAAGGLLLPNATLQVERIRAMDAEVTYRAAAVNAPRLPLRKVSLDLDLKNGVLNLNPISFGFSRGDLTGQIKLDARGKVPRTDADLRLTNGRLEEFITIRNDGKPALEGVIAARVKLTGYGDSVHKAAASSDGAVTIVIPKGEIRQAFAELLGINASKGLLLLLADSNKETSLRCGLADFKVAKGVMTAQQVVFDTGVVLAKGSGTIDLETERMDLRIDGDSKKARLVRLFAPITIKGPLSQPKVGVELGRVAAQGGVAAVLTGLLGPLAALLPFVDPGLEKNADCIALMQEARTAPAPVRITTAITTELPKKK
jgi:uncharacterized protein involved in outer membrane biogenesis